MNPKRVFIVAVASAILQFVGSPLVGLWPCVFLAFVPLLLLDVPWRERAVSGLVTGLLAWTIALRWLPGALSEQGVLPAWQAWLVVLLVGCVESVPLVVSLAVGFWSSGRRNSHLLSLLTWALLHALLEEVMPRPIPYATAAAVADLPLLVQPAWLGGRWVVSLLIFLTNGFIAQTLRAALSKRPEASAAAGRGSVRFGLGVLCIAMLAWVGLSALRVRGGHPAPQDVLRIVLVQQQKDPADRSSPTARARLLERHIQLTKEALAAGDAGLVIWGETILDANARGDAVDAPPALQAPLLSWGVPLLSGAGVRSGDGVTTNSAVVFPRGEYKASQANRYDKRRLVPYVETTGLLFPSEGHPFRKGTEARTLRVAERELGVSICFEGAFSSLQRSLVQAGAQLLVNLTSDAWIADRGAQRAHAALAALASVELGRDQVRIASGGPSLHIDPFGNVQVLVPVGEEGSASTIARTYSEQTPYSRVRGWFLGFAWLLLVLLLTPLFRKRASRPEGSIRRCD